MRRLLIRPGAIGDCIVSLPAMERLVCSYTEVWAPSRNLPLIRFASGTRSLASTGIDLVGITEPALAAFSEYDSIVSWYGANRPEFRDAVSHLPFTFLPAIPDGSCHAVDFYMRQVGGPDGAVPHIACEAEPGDYFACHPFSGGAWKNWPLENYRTLPLRFCAGPEQDLEGRGLTWK